MILSERTDIKIELEKLREQISTLKDLPPLSQQFVAWLGRLFKLVETEFGLNSEEMYRLRAISPELPSEFYDSITTRIRSLGLDEKLTGQILTSLYKDTPEKVFKQRLYEYDGFIASLYVGLQPNTR